MSCPYACSSEVEHMTMVAKGAKHGPAPIQKKVSGSRFMKPRISPVSPTVWAGALLSRAPASSR